MNDLGLNLMALSLTPLIPIGVRLEQMQKKNPAEAGFFLPLKLVTRFELKLPRALLWWRACVDNMSLNHDPACIIPFRSHRASAHIYVRCYRRTTLKIQVHTRPVITAVNIYETEVWTT